VAPVSKVICGVPVTVTASVKVTLISITSPALYVPLALLEETDETVGAVVSSALLVAVALLVVKPVLEVD